MGLFDRFRKKPPQEGEGHTSPPDLPGFCYGMAYYLLPQLLSADADRTIGYFTQTDKPAGAYLYVLACSIQQIEPSPEHAREFRVHNGLLPSGKEYHVLQYPAPPPLDMNLFDPARFNPFTTVLAPHFSAVLRDPATGATSYYILGQRPGGGTTLRNVTGGMNANLGEGPPPELDAFLAALATR